MKRNLIILSGLTLVGIAAYFGLSGDKEPIRYDPVVYEDGSTEYRLINAGKDRIRGNEDDQHWVMRFPKGLYVNALEETPGLKGRKLNPAFQYNRDITIIVTLPDFGFVEQPFGGPRNDQLDVHWTGEEVKYGTGVYQKAGSSFSSHHDAYTNFDCRKDKEIFSGLYKLRDPTDAEIQAMRDKYGPREYFYDDVCGVTDPMFTHYSVYDTSGRPIGRGDCYPLKKLDESYGEKGQCTFRFWQPQSREISYSFRKQYLPQIHDIHAGVVDLISAATDEQKSINMFDKGEK